MSISKELGEMSFTDSASRDANVFILASVWNQNLALTARIVPYVEAYAQQNRIGVHPIEQIQQAYEDEKEGR